MDAEQIGVFWACAHRWCWVKVWRRCKLGTRPMASRRCWPSNEVARPAPRPGLFRL